MGKNGIQKIAITIMIVGSVCAFIIGGATQYADPSYLADVAKYPTLYSAENAPHLYNWFNCFAVLSASLLSGFLFYCLGTIVQNQRFIMDKFKERSGEKNDRSTEKPQDSEPSSQGIGPEIAK